VSVTWSWKRVVGIILCIGLLYLPPLAASGEASRLAAAADLGSAGELKHFRFESERLNDRMDLRVNVATGNLILHAKDLKIDGTGLDVEVERFYNSLSSSSSQYGPGWVMSAGKDVRLDPQSSGEVVYFGRSGFRVTFKSLAGGFSAPNGVDAKLEKKADGTYELVFNSSKEKFRFAASGRFTEQVDKNGNRNAFTYNSDGTLGSITDSRNRKTTFTYSGGLLTTMKDFGARLHTYGYDSSKRLVAYTDPAKGTTTYAYDSAGLLTLITDPRGGQTKVQYDADRRATSVTRVTDVRTGVGSTTQFAYTASEKKTVVTDARGNETTYKYDDDNKVTKVTDAKGKSRDVSYNSRGNVTTYLDAGQSTPLKFDYDPTEENVTSVTLPTSGTANFKYEDQENPHYPTSVFDFSNDSKTEPTYAYDYDSKGNLVSATDKLGHKHSYVYNSNGTLKTVTDARNNATSYSYDASGHQIKITPPAPLKPITFTFDGVSRMTSMTDGNNRKSSFAYDLMDRVTKITYADGSSVSYGYDANGNLVWRQDSGGGRINFTYDALNRVVKETPPSLGGLLTYTYDSVGNLTSLSDDGGTTRYEYDKVNVVTSVTDPQGRKTTFGYDEDQNTLRTETNYPNGVKVGIQYDDSSRITEVKTTRAATGDVLNRFAYGYQSAAGLDTNLRQHVTDMDGNKTAYSYDGVNRLTGAKTTNGSGQQTDVREYSYDPNSNLTTKKDNSTTTSFAFNAANQLCWSFNGSSSAACASAPAGATKYVYDGAGNLTSTSLGLALLYNAKNQTTSMKPPGGTAESMTYQGPDQTRRLSKGSIRFGYNVLGLSAQTNGGSGVANTTYFTRDNRGTLVSQRGPNNQTHYYLFDGLGSVVGLTDASGAQVASYSYEPWGGQTSAEPSVANPWRFASGYKDAGTGFTKFGTRYYDPTTARWTQQDPIRGEIKQPITLNLYHYAHLNPVNVTDPSGRIGIVAVGLIAAAAGVSAYLAAVAVGAGDEAASFAGGCVGAVAAFPFAKTPVTAGGAALGCVGAGGLWALGVKGAQAIRD
jgi:RHS repeat-associated protein